MNDRARASATILLVVIVVLLALPGGTAPIGRGTAATGPLPPAMARGVRPLGSAPSGYEWANLATYSPAPMSNRGDYGIAYDPIDHYLVEFGGELYSGSWANDTWTYANGVWTNISATAGPAPSPRYDPAMAWDGEDGYILLFGGSPGTNIGSNDTYSFVHGRWTAHATTHAPAQRYEAALVDDPVNHEMILWGGSYGGAGTYYNDTWSYKAGTWTDLTSLVGKAPSPRRGDQTAWDNATGEMVVFGGVDAGFTPMNDTWTFVNNTWTKLTLPLSPPARWLGGVAYDAAAGAIVISAGSTTQGCGSSLADTWWFTGAAWTKWKGNSTAPPSRCATEMAYDPDVTGDVYIGVDSSASSGFGMWDLTPNLLVRVAATPGFDLGQTWRVNATVAGGVPPYTGDLAGSPDLGCTSTGGSGTVGFSCTATASTTTVLNLTINDSLTKQEVRSVNVTVEPALTTTLAAAQAPLDVGQTLRLTATASGGAGIYADRYTGLPTGCTSANVTTLTCVVTAAGSYTVTFTATDQWGGSNRSSIPVVVESALAASVSVAAPADDLGYATNLTVRPTGGLGPYAYAWSGLPTGCATANVSQLVCTPEATGRFVTVVTLVDGTGASFNTSTAWTVEPLPTVQISVPLQVALVGESLGFTATPANGTGPYTFGWTFGDGTVGVAGVSASHAFTAAGAYPATVTLADVFGATAVAAVTITVVAPLAVRLNLSAPKLTVGATVELDAQTTGGDGPFTETWTTLPSGCGSASGPTVVCTPTAAGTYFPAVTVADALGESIRSSGSVVVAAPAQLALFDVVASNCSLAVQFTAEVRSGGTAPFAFGWTFGDGSVADGENTSHTFAAPGTYPIVVTATDASGIQRNATVSLTVPNSGVTCTVVPPTGNSSSSEVGTLELYAGLAIAGIAVLAVVGIALARRRPPSPPPEPELPDGAAPVEGDTPPSA